MSVFSDIINFVRNIPLFVDGVGMQNTINALQASQAKEDNWWASPSRLCSESTEENLVISYGTERLINYLDFQVSHFPHEVIGEYQEARTGTWYPLEFAQPQSISAGPISSSFAGIGQVYDSVSDSSPQIIGVRSELATTSSQSFGPNAWISLSWRVQPVQTQKIRLTLRRTTNGSPPQNVSGDYAPYSLAVNNFQAGYQVNTIADIPKTQTVQTNRDSTFTQTTDIHGSSVAYSLYQDSPSNVTQSADSTAMWRSNPQPMNYAVVNFFADTRDAQGNGQVIDRFFLDPTTAGPNMNIYWSNDPPPVEDHPALDDVLVYPILNILGVQPSYTSYYQDSGSNFVAFTPDQISVLEVDNSYLQFPVTSSWWFGMEVISTVNVNGVIPGQLPNDHPWLSLGQNYLRQKYNTLEFWTENNQHAVLPLPNYHGLNTHAHVVVAYTAEAGGQIPQGYSLWYKSGDEPTLMASFALSPPKTPVDKIRVNGYPHPLPLTGPDSPGIGGLHLRSLILKDVAATQDQINGFLADGTVYSATNEFPNGPQNTDNALLRINPQFTDNNLNPTGIVGGARTHYSDITWTPIARDYTLRKGFVFVPPTQAKFWKFEFTNLVAEIYESFVEMRRSVQLFPVEVVQKYQEITQSGSWSGYGIDGIPFILSNVGGIFDYAQALQDLSYSREGATATEVLVTKDPTTYQTFWGGVQGWIWNFRPWHVGQGAPRFTEVSKHIYQTVEIDHRDKLAYFVGLKQLQAYRVDYAADSDTLRYYDAFLDTTNIDLPTMTGVSVGTSKLQSQGSFAQVQSKTLNSTRNVRAIQFATTQTEAHTLLADDFSDPDLSHHWRQYGDATLVRTNNAHVTVARGWFARRYSDYEGKIFSSLEGTTYGQLEGTQSNGLAGGGISSDYIFPSNSGRIFAAAQISSPGPLNGPLVIQIVSEIGGIVLAEQPINLSQGGQTLVSVSYQPGSVATLLFYSGLEGVGTYGTIEGSTYVSHERRAITGRIYARVVQQGPTTDNFTVLKMAIFDAPIEWSFSVDDGVTWFASYDVRNKTSGVLTLPVKGRKLKWRAKMYTPGATISALAIRPWYGGQLGIDSAPSRMAGPNRATHDEVPPIFTDSMWAQWDSALPSSWVNSVAIEGAPLPLPTSGQPLTPA